MEKNTGIKLTESCAMWPGASVSGLYFAHPGGEVFWVGKIGRDQVLDYQLPQAMDLRDSGTLAGTVSELRADRRRQVLSQLVFSRAFH